MQVLSKFIIKTMHKTIVGELKIKHKNLMEAKDFGEDSDFIGQAAVGLYPRGRVDALLGEMTLLEKIQFVGGYEKFAIHPLPRLGLPSIWSSDATSGLRCFTGGTAFLSGLAMAATWDQEMIESVGAAIGEEFRAKGVSILLGPGVNIYRVPTCGRNFEYMGEDPVLAGKMSAAYIRGAQGKGVLTTVKHFTANNSDYDRHKTDSVVDERALHEIYLTAFRLAIHEGGSWGVMSAYNPVNGVYASENEYLLTEVLRNRWAFKGFVISDWDSVYSTVPAVKNGLNLEMPFGKWVNEETVTAAIEAGELVEEDIEDMIRPLLNSLIEAGVYDRPMIDPTSEIHTAGKRALARRAAERAITLLKNDSQILPLENEAKKKMILMGRTMINTPTGGGGSSYVHRPESVDFATAITNEFDDWKITLLPFRKDRLTRAEKSQIREADVVILGAGFLTYEEAEAFDRPWTLPEKQPALIRKVAALNPNVIVLLTVGGGIETESWIRGVKGLVHCYYLGEEGAAAVAKALSGEVNPGGKLPFTMAKRWEDIASTAYYVDDPGAVQLKRLFIGQGDPGKRKVWKMEYGEGLRVGYRHFDSAGIEPQFAFGHGLTYSEFEFGNLSIEAGADLVHVALDVSNTGERAGSEVVQVYVRDVESSVYRPEKELKAFSLVDLLPGESTRVFLELDSSAFSFYDPEIKGWREEPGDFEILIGNSSRNILLEQRISRI
jgi:beta-glucosidase